MDIGLLHNNHMYYDGFEGEEEVEITLVNDQSININFWVGYLDDILSDPDLTGKGWTGFTRDYHQLEGAFSSDSNLEHHYDPTEYLHDISQYQDADFAEEESYHVLRLIITILEYAVSIGSKVFIRAK